MGVIKVIKKNINISINLYAFAVEANKIEKSNSGNNSLILYNRGIYIGSVDLDKYKFEFSWANEYTNYYRLIER